MLAVGRRYRCTTQACGELAGLRGEGTIAVDTEGNHELTLEYELD